MEAWDSQSSGTAKDAALPRWTASLAAVDVVAVVDEELPGWPSPLMLLGRLRTKPASIELGGLIASGLGSSHAAATATGKASSWRGHLGQSRRRSRAEASRTKAPRQRSHASVVQGQPRPPPVSSPAIPEPDPCPLPSPTIRSMRGSPCETADDGSDRSGRRLAGGLGEPVDGSRSPCQPGRSYIRAPS